MEPSKQEFDEFVASGCRMPSIEQEAAEVERALAELKTKAAGIADKNLAYAVEDADIYFGVLKSFGFEVRAAVNYASSVNPHAGIYPIGDHDIMESAWSNMQRRMKERMEKVEFGDFSSPRDIYDKMMRKLYSEFDIPDSMLALADVKERDARYEHIIRIMPRNGTEAFVCGVGHFFSNHRGNLYSQMADMNVHRIKLSEIDRF